MKRNLKCLARCPMKKWGDTTCRCASAFGIKAPALRSPASFPPSCDGAYCKPGCVGKRGVVHTCVSGGGPGFGSIHWAKVIEETDRHEALLLKATTDHAFGSPPTLTHCGRDDCFTCNDDVYEALLEGTQ